MPAAGGGAGRCRRCGAALIPGGRFCPQCAAPVKAPGGRGDDPFAATQVAPAASGAVAAASGSPGGGAAARGDPRRVVIPPTVLEVAAPAAAGGGPGGRRGGGEERRVVVPPTVLEVAAPPAVAAAGRAATPTAAREAAEDRIGWGAVLAAASLLLLGIAAAVAAQFIPWERWL